VQSVFEQNQPNLQTLTNQVTNQVIPGLMGRVGQSGQTVGQAQDYLSNVLGGNYLNGNPHLQQMIDATNNDVTNKVNSQFETAGRYGSDAHGSGLTRELATADNALRYQNYGDEMNRMGQAAGMAAQISDQDIARLLGSIGIGAQLPYTGSSNLANSLGALFSGGTEQSKSVGAKPGLFDYLAQAASNAASAYAGGGGG
jgi:hypothetical protein